MLARVTANQLAPGRPSDRFDEEASVPKRRSLLGSAVQQAAFLSRPLSTTRCVLGWVVATGLFLGCVSLWYTSSVSDNLESLVPAAAFEQGSLHCAYPPEITSSVPPLYPLIAAGVMEVTRIGASEAGAYLYTGAHCVTPDNVVYRSFSAKQSLYLLGFIGWPFLLAGFVALVRASGRGRSRYEFLGVCLLACAPAVAEPLVEFFHPEDMVAMGLILLGLAAAIRRRWAAAGLCIGLACCTKQYALLAMAPLLVAAPRRERWRFLAATVAVAAAVLVPVVLLVGRDAFDAIAGTHATPGGTVTLVGRLHLHGLGLVAASRALPLALAGVIAGWARSRLGSAVLRPQPLVAILAASLALRLVFEVNLFGYYFMATAVALVALDIVVGHVRVETVGWILAVAAFYPPFFEPLVLVAGRDALIVQPVLSLSGLALAALPLWRLCREAAAPASATPVRAGSAAASPAA
jgi:glycosyl transferase family 87